MVGGLILLFDLWLIGHYRLDGITAVLLTVGFAAGFEYLVVRPASKSTINHTDETRYLRFDSTKITSARNIYGCNVYRPAY